MDFIYFVTVLAWILVVPFTLRYVVSKATIVRYNSKAGELERLLDGIRGYQKVYKSEVFDFILTIATITWLVVYYFG